MLARHTNILLKSIVLYTWLSFTVLCSGKICLLLIPAIRSLYISLSRKKGISWTRKVTIQFLNKFQMQKFPLWYYSVQMWAPNGCLLSQTNDSASCMPVHNFSANKQVQEVDEHALVLFSFPPIFFRGLCIIRSYEWSEYHGVFFTGL